MKLTPYKELIKMGKEAVEAAGAVLRVRAQSKRAELEVIKLEEEQAKIEQQLQEMCATKELDYNKILDKHDELSLCTRRLEQLQEITEQLFPHEK